MADDGQTFNQSFTLLPPNNQLADYEKVAQDAANAKAKEIGKWVTLNATYTAVGVPPSLKTTTLFGDPGEAPANKEPNVCSFKDVSMTKLADGAAFAKEIATAKAAVDGKPTTVTLPDGSTATVQPPPRPKDIQDAAKGTPSTTPPPAEARSQQASLMRAMANGQKNENESPEDGPANSGGNPLNQVQKIFGPIRQLSAQIPAMESLLMNVPQAALGKFVQALPATFKSLLPVGSLPGLNVQAPVSLNGLVQLVGGAALGSVAGQAIRSLSGGISSVSGMSGLLGAQAIAKVTGSSAIPVNISSTFGNALLSNGAGAIAGNLAKSIGGTPQTAAVIANVVGTVTNVALRKNSTGIPISSQTLGLAANVALRAAGVPVSIPTSVLGLASSSGLGSVASLIGGTVSARIPVLPTNLSLPNIGSLSGITQNLSPGLADNIIPSGQLQGLLPPNLQSQIPAVPGRLSAPGATNEVVDRQRASSAQVPDKDLQPNGTPTPAKPAVIKGTDNGRIPYEQKISPNGLTLGQLSNKAQFPHNIVPQNGLSVDQIIEGLSWVATNILDPIFSAYSGWTITSGYRGPGGSNTTGDHGRGAAVDFKWYSKSKLEHLEICKWIRQQGLPVDLLIYERPGGFWIHTAGGPTVRPSIKGAKLTQTFLGGSTYVNGLVA